MRFGKLPIVYTFRRRYGNFCIDTKCLWMNSVPTVWRCSDNLYSMALICLLLLVVVLPAEVTAQFELLYNTPLSNRLENRITIGCYQDTFPVNSAQFWVRRQGLAVPDQLQSLVTVQRPQPHQVAFVITQDLEGSYFCSHNNMFSNTLDLVGEQRWLSSEGCHSHSCERAWSTRILRKVCSRYAFFSILL